MTSVNDWRACLTRMVIAALAVVVMGVIVSAGSAAAQSSDMYIWEKVYGGSNEVDVATDVRQASH